jgi:hypothetical protein
MPIYMMGLFQLHEGVHQQMDTIRSKIFWGSDGEKFKYHMVKWENTCLPRYFGVHLSSMKLFRMGSKYTSGSIFLSLVKPPWGGLLNTKILNEVLLIKWVWRIYNQEGGRVVICFIGNISKISLSQAAKPRGSQFWQGVNKVKHNFKWGATFAVNNGKMFFFGKMYGLAKRHLSYPSQNRGCIPLKKLSRWG